MADPRPHDVTLLALKLLQNIASLLNGSLLFDFRSLELRLLSLQHVLEHLGGRGPSPDPPELLRVVPTPWLSWEIHVNALAVRPGDPGAPGIDISPPQADVVANHYEGPSRPSEANVHSPPVGHEADAAMVVASDGRENDGLLLPSLESIYGANFY